MECAVLRQCVILKRTDHANWRHKSPHRALSLRPHLRRQTGSLRTPGKYEQALVKSSLNIQLRQDETGGAERSNYDAGKGGTEDDAERESLKTLEWFAICEQVSRFASTPMARDLCKEGYLPFGKNQGESEKLLEQTASALLISDTLDFTGIVDVRAILRSATAGEVLNVTELCVVKKMLSSSRRVFDELIKSTPAESNIATLSANASKRGALAPLLAIMENANFCISLLQDLDTSLDSSSLSILDAASPRLSSIRVTRRENMKTLESFLLETGEKVVAAGGMDTVIVTTRRARQCIAIRSSHKHLLPGGVILDVSNTGATVFMEPKAALKLNNNEVELASKERSEELLILERLTRKLADVAGDVSLLLEKLTRLDMAFAKAGHGRWLSSVKPSFSIEINSSIHHLDRTSKVSETLWVYIEGLYHPLLLGQTLLRREEQEDASFPVPLDFKVKFGIRVIVISGPNTGGKTASMKAFGIACLMAKAGLFVPARGKAVIPWFDQVLADIGDSQSLEQNLSTFSGHIRRVRRIMEAASHKSLVLFDEIGSGTDPSEGAALASAILERMADHSYLTIVTTHFSKLSRFSDDRFEVASVEFDTETLRPKYTILWGVAGQSNALDIASILGIDDHILARARHWMRMLAPENERKRLAQLMNPLIQQRGFVKSQAEAAQLVLADAKKLHDELEAEADSLQVRIAALRLQQEDKMKKEVNAAKSHMEKIVSDYESSLKNPDKDGKSMPMGEALGAIASVVDAHMEAFGKPEKTTSLLGTASRPSIGDSVLIRRLGKTPATVLEDPTDDDESFLVQLGDLKVRVKMGEVTEILKSEKSQQPGAQLMRRAAVAESPKKPTEETLTGPVFQTSRNSVDLRGMRVDEALMNLDFAFLRHQRASVFFIIHGEGTGALRASVLERLRGHPMVLRFEQESPMNYGCTVVYLK